MSPPVVAMGRTKLTAALLVALCLATGAANEERELIKGISYGPVPLLSQVGAAQLPQDDWMSDEAMPMWGKAGRADLRVMKDLGANLVRLYGNNPENDHTNFLDEAWAEGLKVAPGMSDYPFYQQVPGRCLDTDFDCFDQVKPMYAQNLAKGFLTPDKSYHPALEVMNIINEPDLKMPPTTDIGGPDGPIKMARTIISAFDAMLDAEREANVIGPLINFTATFSYAICGPCEQFNESPALGQMWQLDDAMKNPSKYGYTPRNDITEAYRTRWTHSFNTQNPATDLKHQFLDDYELTFPSTPVYIGEYHRVGANQTEDLSLILGLAEHSNLFLGISYFEFQVAYWKTGSEMDFGMFGLGDDIISDMPYFGETYQIHCLVPEESTPSGMSLPAAVAKVYGGQGIETSTLCQKNPWGVALNAEGYQQIQSENSLPQMRSFVQRVVQHLGAIVTNFGGLTRYAKGVLGSDKTFAQMVSELAWGPDWVQADPAAKCAANRNVIPHVIGEAIGWVCSQAPDLCEDVPTRCSTNPYRQADYIFSRYYQRLGQDASALTSCDFGGAGEYSAKELYNSWTGSLQCIQGAVPTENRPHRDVRPIHHDLAPAPEADAEATTTTTVDENETGTTYSETESSFATSALQVDRWLLLALLAGCGLLWA